MIHPYHESLLSLLYPGNQHSSNCLIPAISTFEQMLPLPDERHSKVVWRLDQGFGGDENINWLLERGYGVLAKGCSNRRSAQLMRQVKRWRPVRSDKFVGCVPTPDGFIHPLQTFSIRYATSTGWKHTYLLSTLNRPGIETALLYDQRGGAETEFRSDKSGGLYLHKRRKHKRDAQETWILLTDLAHNCLSWVARTIFKDSPFADFGFLRITRDLLSIPGTVEFEQGQLLSVKLLRTSPFANDLLECLARFWE
ncbi:MAG: transposase [Caldilinea sp.]